MNRIALLFVCFVTPFEVAFLQAEVLMPQRLSFQRLYFQTELKRQSLIEQSFVPVLPFYLGRNI